MSVTLKPRSATVVLYQGDDQEMIDVLVARLERIRAEKKAARNQPQQPMSLLDGDPEVEIMAEIAEVEKAAAERGVTVVLHALKRRQWSSLIDEHTKEPEGDKEGGLDLEALSRPLLLAAIAEPQFPAPSDAEDFLDMLSSAQYENLFGRAFALNRTLGADPKDVLPSPHSPS